MVNRRLNVSLTEIKKLYFGERLTLTETGKRLGVSSVTIVDRLKENGLNPRPHGQRRMHTEIAFNLLKRLYNDKRLTITEIAKHVGTTRSGVFAACKRHGIKMRPRGPRVKYPQLSSLRIGEGIDVPRPGWRGEGRGNFLKMGQIQGIRLTVKKIGETTVRLTRT